jgi:hypothetical protein
MTLGDFKKIVEKRFEFCKDLLYHSKNVEYSRNNDKLHNFKQAAAMKCESPEKALWGMWVKHIISIQDMIADTEKGIVPSERTIDEKMSDNINYTLLLEALLRERVEHTACQFARPFEDQKPLE